MSDFRCHNCAWCCKSLNINVSYHDILRFAKERRYDILAAISYIDSDDPKKRGFYITDTVTSPKKPCPFLVDNQCSIYETRPRSCADFPIAYTKEEQEQTECGGLPYSYDERESHELRKDQSMDFIIAEDRKEQLIQILADARDVLALQARIQEFGDDPTESLYATGFANNKTGWTRVGTTPWLSSQNQPTDYVWTATKKAEIGDWTFANSSNTGSNLGSVSLYVYGQSAGVSGDNTFYIYDGSSWTDAGLPALPNTWGWVNVDVSAVLNTWTKVDAAQFYIAHANTTNRTDVDAAYLFVNYTTASGGTVDATIGTATAAGVVPSITVAQTVTGTIATATAAGLVPTVSASRSARVTWVQFSVPASSGAASVTATVATASAAAIAPTATGAASVTGAIGTATAAGVAPTITVSASVTGVVASASAAGIAPAATVTQTVTGVVATATASGLAPSVGVAQSVTATTATATGAGLAPTLTGAASVTGTVATATAAGIAPSVTAGAVGEVVGVTATASAAGVAPSLSYGQTVLATVGTSTAAGVAPVLSYGQTVTATIANATAAAIAPAVSGSGGSEVVSVTATATAAGIAPTVSGVVNASVTATIASATAEGVAPTVSAGFSGSVIATIADATAAGLAPSVTGGVTITGTVATATGAGVAPTLSYGYTVISTAGEATAAGIAPTVTGVNIADGLVTAVVMVATASMPAPRISQFDQPFTGGPGKARQPNRRIPTVVGGGSAIVYRKRRNG